MGMAKQRRQAFFEKHKFCAFCGGSELATTVEHCPPRALFFNRLAPEGFEFPACEKCNGGSSDEDAMIAFLGRMNPVGNTSDKDGRLNGLMMNVNRQFPGLLQRIFPSPAEARRSNRAMGIRPQPGQTHQEQGAVLVTAEMDEAVRKFAAKLTKAIYYMDTGLALPAGTLILFHWQTNADWAQFGQTVFDALKDFGGKQVPLVRNAKSLGDQFEYKSTGSAESGLFLLQAKFGYAFGFVTISSVDPAVLQAITTRLRASTGREGPFREI